MWWKRAYVGQKVTPVGNGGWVYVTDHSDATVQSPEFGKIYVLSAIETNGLSRCGIAIRLHGCDGSYVPDCFRPVDDTSTEARDRKRKELFDSWLRPAPVKERERA